MDKRTALVFGASGLVGKLLAEELSGSDRYGSVRIFVRKATGMNVGKISETVSDLTDIASIASLIRGDDLFICLGTTIKKAGSVAGMEKTDRDLPVKIASTAFSNGIRNIAVVSSLGASSSSSNYYLRIKGEMEEGIINSGIENVSILRPSMLLGERKEKRAGEIAGKVVMAIFKPLLAGKFRKYRAIDGKVVAKAMVSLILEEKGKRIIESDVLQQIGSSHRG